MVTFNVEGRGLKSDMRRDVTDSPKINSLLGTMLDVSRNTYASSPSLTSTGRRGHTHAAIHNSSSDMPTRTVG